MSRHTKNDGKTPDERIKSVDEHQSSLGPSPTLIGSYYKRGLSWEKYQELYLSEIRTEPKSSLVRALAKKALTHDVTLLCIEETAEQCHRRLLAEECQTYEPELDVIHR